MNKNQIGVVQLLKEKSRQTGSERVKMKTLHKVLLALVAIAGLTFATPAQARWFHHHVFIGGFYGPAYYGYYNPYYAPYYGYYYGPYYGGGATFAFGGGHWHGGHYHHR
jgi:hypothetical protein